MHALLEDTTISAHLATVWRVNVRRGHWPACFVHRPSWCHNSSRCWCHPDEGQSRCGPPMPQRQCEQELNVWWGPTAGKSTGSDLGSVIGNTPLVSFYLLTASEQLILACRSIQIIHKSTWRTNGWLGHFTRPSCHIFHLFIPHTPWHKEVAPSNSHRKSRRSSQRQKLSFDSWYFSNHTSSDVIPPAKKAFNCSSLSCFNDVLPRGHCCLPHTSVYM